MTDEPLLSVRGLSKHYPIRSGLFRRETGRVRAVDGVDFELRRGETLGLVGESGCGKSTAARTLLQLESPTDGTVTFDGERVGEFDAAGRKRFRRRAQLLLQEPDSAFNPRIPVWQSLVEPLEIHGVRDRSRQEAVVEPLLDRVGIDVDVTSRYPHEFSGGQKQRLALARALTLSPALLVADEPVSALDERVQARVLSLLDDVQHERNLAILFISHDIRLVRQFCDRVAVMYLGEIVERGPVDAVLSDPQHPYTRALVDATPALDPQARGQAKSLSGDVPDPANPPSGCRFHTRCPAVIPPDTYDLEQRTWRAVFDLRLALEAGEVAPDALRERLVSRGKASTADAVTDDQLRHALRERYGLPATVADEAAEDALSTAIGSVVDGQTDAAADAMAAAFETICERRPPDVHETGVSRAACHLHDER